MYQPNTFRMSYETKISDITTPAQRRLALAYLKRWAQKDKEQREERRLLSTMTPMQAHEYCADHES